MRTPDPPPGWLSSLGATLGPLSVSRRRLLAAVCAAMAVVCGITAARPRAAPTRSIWVAARDLTGGVPLASADLRPERLPTSDVPRGSFDADSPPVGRLLASPVRRGEPLTDLRLLSPSLLAASGLAGCVAVPVRLTDGAAALALVHAGDHVDVLAAAAPGDGSAGEPASAATVVHDVTVLTTPTRTPAAATGGDGGGLVVVAATPRQAVTLAQAASSGQLSLVVRRPG